MANIIPHKKFQQPNHYKQGNILLLVMGVMVLTSCLMLSYQYQANHLRNKLQQNKKLLKEKQALNLAHFAFNQLKAIATNDFIATCEKNGKLHFYNVQTESSQDLGSLEFYSNEYKMGVTVLMNEDLNNTTHCLFQEGGLRKTMTNECFSEITHTYQKEINQRWNHLQTNDYLISPLFFPLVSELQRNDNTINLTLYNPFDKNIQGKINIQIQGYDTIQTYSLIPGIFSVANKKIVTKQGDINISPKKTSSITISLSETFTSIDKIILEDLTYTDLKVGKHQVVYSKLNEPFSYSQDFRTSSDTRNVGRWGRKKSAPTHTSTETTINTSHELPCFETQNWLQQLNACCFFGEKGKPYLIINNFEMDEIDSIKLRDFFWNRTIADPKAPVFNFNASEQYLRKRLSEMRWFIPEENIKHILSHQPYSNAIAFLKEIKNFQDKLYLFKNLTHRTECFNIQSYCENVRCTMTVCRIAKSPKERAWKIQNIELIIDKLH